MLMLTWRQFKTKVAAYYLLAEILKITILQFTFQSWVNSSKLANQRCLLRDLTIFGVDNAQSMRLIVNLDEV